MQLNYLINKFHLRTNIEKMCHGTRCIHTLNMDHQATKPHFEREKTEFLMTISHFFLD